MKLFSCLLQINIASVRTFQSLKLFGFTTRFLYIRFLVAIKNIKINNILTLFPYNTSV